MERRNVREVVVDRERENNKENKPFKIKKALICNKKIKGKIYF